LYSIGRRRSGVFRAKLRERLESNSENLFCVLPTTNFQVCSQVYLSPFLICFKTDFAARLATTPFSLWFQRAAQCWYPISKILSRYRWKIVSAIPLEFGQKQHIFKLPQIKQDLCRIYLDTMQDTNLKYPIFSGRPADGAVHCLAWDFFNQKNNYILKITFVILCLWVIKV